ncbi:Oidioi.mRNA.OKI2018_I69.chr1.g87.t1.cds [Oikopleura dioica]|uniref:Oidioi.mRNA.OKI2018_I69.chr1.g87.t1.cds n=1 Tax=Oikopleura dioica TaxID=34765 RepID=A0ABN7SIS4_OIKDI|nr:Oidioi.mRNA.OKI2018_I69.chr1.g87.t1.cds [Oikopleura dioica]
MKSLILFLAVRDAYQITDNDRCSAIRDPQNLNSTIRPVNLPQQHDNMGRFECTAHRDHSCCDVETNREVYTRPINKIGMWSFGQCNANPWKNEECNAVSDTCSEMMQSFVSEIRCSPNLFPWQSSFPVNSVILNRDPAPTGYELVNVPICSDWCQEFYDHCKYEHVCLDVDPFYSTGGSDPDIFPLQDWNCVTGSEKCKTFETVIKSGRDFCQNFFPEPNIITVQNDLNNCIRPGDHDNNMELMKRKLESMAYTENLHPEEFWPNNCPWWFWWHIFLIILGVILVVLIFAFIIMKITKRGKFGSGILFNPSSEPKKRSTEDGEQNDSYSMSDQNPPSSRLRL